MAAAKKRGKAGRPTKRNAEADRQILAALEVGCSYESAALIIGVDRDTILAWRKADPEFSAACEKAQGSARLRMSSALFNKGVEGDTVSMIFWLKCRTPDFREGAAGVEADAGQTDAEAWQDMLASIPGRALPEC